MYEPLQVSKCKKCGKIIAEPKELIRIMRGSKTMNKEESEEEKKIRLQDERLAIFNFGRLMEKSLREQAEIEDIDIEFRSPNVSPDAILWVKMKNGEEYRINVEFEGWSSNFKTHKDDVIKTDLIVCTLLDRNDFDVPILDVMTGKTFKPNEDVKESFWEQIKELRKKGEI